MESLLRPMRAAAAVWHRLLGRAWFRLGKLDAAQSRFERVLELVGDDFTAHAHLGRIAWAVGDYPRWRRACWRAKRIAPRRGARLEQRFELTTPRCAGALVQAPAGGGNPDMPRPCCKPADDCVSPAERERFRRLGPIALRDVESADVGTLSRRLAEVRPPR